MTARAVILGLLGALFVGAVSYFNDVVMQQTFLFNTYIPLFLYGAVILFVCLANPLLGRLSGRCRLSGNEIALAIAIILPSCYVGSRALIHRLSAHLMAPRYMNPTELGWQRYDLLDRAPAVMLAGVAPEYDADDVVDARAVCGSLAGLGELARPGERALRAGLGDRDRDAVAGALALSRPDAGECADAVVDALNCVLPRRDLFRRSDFEGVTLPKGAEALFGDAPLAERKVRRLNRDLVDLVYGSELRSRSAKEEVAVRGFQLGLGEGTGHIGLSEVPWHAWKRTLCLFWFPLILAFCAVFMGLALVVHRRWSEQERYPYPIATFARSLLPEKGAAIPGVLRNPMFWAAAGVIAFVHLNNCAFMYWSEYMVEIPRRFDFSSLADLVPVLRRGGVGALLRPTIYFTAVGLAYFMASDVSFSLGVAAFAWALVAGVFAGYGVALRSGFVNSLRPDIFISAGAFLGLFLIIVYTGRYHYASVFRRGLGLGARDEVRPHEVAGARIFIGASVVFVLLCVFVGIALHWAIIYLAVLVMVYLGVGRLVAEAGIFVIHPHVYPTVLLWGFLGARVVGPQQMFLMFLLGAVFSLGFYMNVLPLFDHGLKLAEEAPGRTAAFGAAGLVLALAVAVPVAVYLQYDHGLLAGNYHWRQWLGFAFDPIVAVENRLGAQGELGGDGAAVLARFSPHWPVVIAFAAGLGLVIGAEALRLRTTWWPIHPILFICGGWWYSRVLGLSFLIGWFIKRMVTKYGGAGVYHRVRPLMFGVIAGDMLAGCAITIFGAIHYFVTGTPPRAYYIVPP